MRWRGAPNVAPQARQGALTKGTQVHEPRHYFEISFGIRLSGADYFCRAASCFSNPPGWALPYGNHGGPGSAGSWRTRTRQNILCLARGIRSVRDEATSGERGYIMTRSINLDRKVTLSQKNRNPRLGQWSLQECDDDGKQIGPEQVPWYWGMDFTAKDLVLREGLTFKVGPPPRWLATLRPDELDSGEEEKITTEESDSIKARLWPGYWVNPICGTKYYRGGTSYSMFGTDRGIKSFKLGIFKREDETKPEYCFAVGGVGFTGESDSTIETAGDFLEFNIYVSAARFVRYVEMIKNHPTIGMELHLSRAYS